MLFSFDHPRLWGFSYTPSNRPRNRNTRGQLIVQAFGRQMEEENSLCEWQHLTYDSQCKLKSL